MARPRHPFLLVSCILVAVPLAAYCLWAFEDEDMPHGATSTVEDIADAASLPSFLLMVPVYRSFAWLFRFLTRQQGEFIGFKGRVMTFAFYGTWGLLCSLQWFALLYFPLRKLLSVRLRREHASSAIGAE